MPNDFHEKSCTATHIKLLLFVFVFKKTHQAERA